MTDANEPWSVTWKTAYEIMPSLVGSEMCIRDSFSPDHIPEEVYHVIKSRLEDGEDYKSAFSPPFDF